MPHHQGGELPAAPPSYPGPDAGLVAIGAAFTAQAGHPGQPGAARPAPASDGLPDIWPLYLSPEQATAAALFDQVDWGPPTGRAWRIESMTIQLNGASLISIYREAAEPQNLRLQTNVSGVWEPRKFILLPGSRMVIVATGGGATIGCIEGEQIRLGALSRYLGGN